MILEAALILSSFGIALTAVLYAHRRDRRHRALLTRGDIASVIAVARRDLRRPVPALPADELLASALRRRLASLSSADLVQLGDAALASDHPQALLVFGEVYVTLDDLRRRDEEQGARASTWRTLRASFDSSSAAAPAAPTPPAYLEPVASRPQEPPGPARRR